MVWVVAALAAGGPVAAAAQPPSREPQGVRPEDVLPRPSVWDSRWFPIQAEERDQARGGRHERLIYIHQNSQMMYIFENGLIVRQIPTSTGLLTRWLYTKPWTGRVGVYWGTFFAYDVYADEAWYLYPDHGSILIHSAPYTIEDGVKVYQDMELLGKAPASHGCIRIHPDDAAWLTQWGPQGVLTVLTPINLPWEEATPAG